MEEKESNQWRLKHIIEAIEHIEEFTKGVDKHFDRRLSVAIGLSKTV
jgi:uncharacterized protein with HEPN domain